MTTIRTLLLPEGFRLDQSRIYLILGILLTALGLLPIWLVDFPPLGDYPVHLLRIHIIRHYHDPNLGYDQMFTVSLFPIPYILADYILIILSFIFSLPISGKILLSIYVISLPCSVFYLIYIFDKSKYILGFLSFLFIYNWYLNMGFVSFSISIPLFLSTLAYWWKNKDDLTRKKQFILSILIVSVYLSHLYTFIFLIYSFIILLILSYSTMRTFFNTLISLITSLILMIYTVVVQLTDMIGRDHVPMVMLYQTLKQRIWLASSKSFFYFMSFSFPGEREVLVAVSCIGLILFLRNIKLIRDNLFFAVLFIGVLLNTVLPLSIRGYLKYLVASVFINNHYILILALSIALLMAFFLLIDNMRNLKKHAFFSLLLMLGILYIMMPVIIAPYFVYFSCRILIFIVLIGLLSLSVPTTPLARTFVLLASVVLSAIYITGTLSSYMSVNRGLKDYYAAIERIPEREYVFFQTGYRLSYVGRMMPYAYFSSYYYMNKSGIIPGQEARARLSEAAVGPLHALHYKRNPSADDHNASASLETLLAWKNDEAVDLGGYAIALSQGPHREVAWLTGKYGYKLTATIGNISIFQRDSYQEDPASQSIPDTKHHTARFYEEYKYLLLYQDEAQIDPNINQDFDRIFSQGYAHLFKRREH